jgi:predicted transporter
MAGIISALSNVVLFAAKTRDELIKEQMESARRTEVLGYVLAVIGILIVIAGIPIAIYRDRKKKARKKPLHTGPNTAKDE